MIGPLRRLRVLGHRPLKPRYDVVIIGGGVHGLAIAYELARRGVRDVAVLERSYIGSGGSGRNTAIIRSNYRTSQGVAFYDESVRIYEGLSTELGFNVPTKATSASGQNACSPAKPRPVATIVSAAASIRRDAAKR